jgi:hypothetical protein
MVVHLMFADQKKRRSARAPRRPGAAYRLGRLLACQAVLWSSIARADLQPTPWEFSLTPYLWLPSVDATMRYETPGTGGSDVSLTNLLQHLNAALFLSGEARKGQWGLSADLVFVDFQKTGSNVSSVGGSGGTTEIPVNSGTTTSLTGYMVSLTGNYSLVRGPDARLDVLGGLRYTHIGTTLDWSFTTTVDSLPGRTGSAERGVDLWDGVVGVRGNARFGGGKWFVPYYLDAGAGTSKFTWQTLVGVGYSFGWGDLLLVYRYLSFEQGHEQPIEHLSFSGPALGATFNF